MTPSVQIQHVSKRYRIGRRLTSLRDMLGGGNNKQNTKYHWAVNDVSVTLQPGESLGIIGPNGAGKTTILKLLSKVTKPTHGKINVQGRFSALIELGAGFHPDLTGRENIYLNGVILGMRRNEIKSRFDQIVDFSGIEPFLDTPVKRYSSGMYARLGFAVAAHVNPDVFLVDEVLAVGDYAFRMKCYDHMDELRVNGTTLIFVSHNMHDVIRVCDRGMVMFRGEKVFEGTASQATAEYSNVLRQNASRNEKPTGTEASVLSERRMTHAATIERVEIIGEDGETKNVVNSGETVVVLVEIHFHEDAPSPVFALTIHRDNGDLVYDTTTRVLGMTTPDFRAGDRILVKYQITNNLLDGIYVMNTDLAYADLTCYYDYIANALSFVVVGGNSAKGIANLNASVSFDTLPTSHLVEHLVESSKEGK